MSQTVSDLAGQAEEFAEVLTEILNGTVTSGVRVTAAVTEDRAYLGVGATESDPLAAHPIPLSTDPDRRDARTWLLLAFQSRLDDQGHHLAVQSSKVGLCVNPDTERCFIRMEFERHKRNYPKAHIQISGSSEELGYAWAVAGHPPKQLQDVRIPVGGVRYRPSLEDFIEFLAAEELVAELHPGWEQLIADHRKAYRRRQLRAAIRQDPDTAVEALRCLGDTITSPRVQ